jgi:hypothetical protein
MGSIALDESSFLAEVESIVRCTEERGCPLRAVGGVGIYFHVRKQPEARSLYLLRDGTPSNDPRFKDLDLAGFEKHSSRIYRLFVRELGFREDRETNSLFGMYRNVYFHPSFQIDVFYDVLRFNHEIPLQNRFPPGITLSPEDLLLSKLQIHQSTPRDLIDIASGVVAFPVEAVDRNYLATVLGNDWGFWYDADQNLQKSVDLIRSLPAGSPEPPPIGAGVAERRLMEYRAFLTALPKSRRWEKRSLRGTKEPWFEPVDELP